MKKTKKVPKRQRRQRTPGVHKGSIADNQPLQRIAVYTIGQNLYERPETGPVAYFYTKVRAAVHHPGEGTNLEAVRALDLWTRHILPWVQRELTKAVKTGRGNWFRTLADVIDQVKEGPKATGAMAIADVWIARNLWTSPLDDEEGGVFQRHKELTSEQLHLLFRTDHPKVRLAAGQSDADELHAFRRLLRLQGVKWKRPLGGPKRRKG